jgi:hypothetical protein
MVHSKSFRFRQSPFRERAEYYRLGEARANDLLVSKSESRRIPLEHDPEKHAPDLMRGGNRFSEKIMLKQQARAR